MHLEVKKSQVILAFLVIYLVWGSTYLGVKYALESFPPFTLTGIRFFSAGSILYILARSRGAAQPTPIHWWRTLLMGILLFPCANGGIVWATKHLPSGMVAMLVAMVPMWIVLLSWLWLKEPRPKLQVVSGIILGFIGLVILISPSKLESGKANLVGALVVVAATFAWSIGSLYSRKVELPSPNILSTGMGMIEGGILLLLIGLILGEWKSMSLVNISLRAVVSLTYLTIVGSVLAFSAYTWLLEVTTPARVVTYAYVNPIVAVILGWLFAGESVTTRILIAMAIILFGVILITSSTNNPKKIFHTDEIC